MGVPAQNWDDLIELYVFKKHMDSGAFEIL